MLKYPKIRSLGNAEVEGFFDDGVIEITEKLDGANCRFSLVNGQLQVGSRNQELPITEITESFNNGLGRWALTNADKITKLLLQIPHYDTLVGEWMVKHSIDYKIEPEVIFYDAYMPNANAEAEFPPIDKRERILDICESNGFTVNRPLRIVHAKDLNAEELINEVSEHRSQLNSEIVCEGVVLKNDSFVNKYGRHCHLKMVNTSFIETNREVFGYKAPDDSKSKMQEAIASFVDATVTEARISKLLHSNPESTFEMKDMVWLPHVIYQDILLEEVLTLFEMSPVVDSKMLFKSITKRLAPTLKNALNDLHVKAL